MKVYLDTCTLPENLSPYPDQEKLLERILKCRDDGKIVIFTSKVTLRETERTPDLIVRKELRSDYDQTKPVPNDEKVLGFHGQADQYGSFIAYPLVSDVQDEAIYDELRGMTLTRADAQHLTQAICNRCEVFLTRDKSILRRGVLVETRFDIRIKSLAEFVGELQSTGLV